MVKVVRFHELGDANVLKLEEMPACEPGKGEIRLKVEAIGLNRAEVLFREGNYVEQPNLPSSLGYEAAGTVEAVGEGVTNLKVGDRVSTGPFFSMREYNVYGESAIVPANGAFAYPENISPIEASTIWIQYLTTYFAFVDIGKLQPNQHVLITAASSSTGYAAIQLAKMMGAVTIATTRTQAKRQNLIDAGADHVIVTNDEDLVARVKEITQGRGVELVYDPIAGDTLAQLVEITAPRATIVIYGILSTKPAILPVLTAITKTLRIAIYAVFEFTGNNELGFARNEEAVDRGTKYIYQGLASRQLKPIIDRTFGLDEIVEAHRYMESNQHNGKIVVTV
ncbi:putative NADPH quinone oxidoreductase [Calothrix sp. NIES-4071]|nr:putative NADPH quinone oxidoreductase [Calothrix sp. NIES-4071]BAZ57960.1 putative NADPH quinone oxidoreductase [Calothrix sp. NIES-4105]